MKPRSKAKSWDARWDTAWDNMTPIEALPDNKGLSLFGYESKVYCLMLCLGIRYDELPSKYGYKVADPDLNRKLDLFSGPHGATLVRMVLINTGKLNVTESDPEHNSG